MIAERPPITNRILVVDDSESNLYVVSTWLRRAGYDVAEARMGTQALNLLATRAFDLAIIDVNLPDMSGYSICEHIKMTARTAAVPVLHMSSTATGSSDRSEGLRRGAEGYLVEPVEREELIATVESLIRAAAAQLTAVRLSRRLQRLNDATFNLNNATDLQRLTVAIAQQASLLFDTLAAVNIVTDEPSRLVVSSAGSPPEIIPCAKNAVAELLELARNSARVDAARVSGICPELPGTGSYLPAELSGEQAGLLLVHASEPADLEKEDAAVLSAFARAAGTALRNMRSYDIERRIALKLQHNLLPDAVPARAGLEIITRYAAGAANVEVGGDFYEIFSLGEERLAIAIGDVAGHSLEAATIMAQLRTAIRCFTLEGHPPDIVLERLNRVLITFHPDVTATACCGIFDAATGQFEFANAGHVPLLHGGREGWSYLPLGGTLLGVDAPPPPVQRYTIEPGETLLLYTDGLVERRGEHIEIGLERLATIASQGDSLTALCDMLIRGAGTDIHDDIAIVAIRRDASV